MYTRYRRDAYRTDNMDPLSDVLSLLKPQAYVTGALSAGDPWSLQLPAYQGIKCYMVVEGTCWLAIEGEPPARLHQGDCLLLPHGKPFVIASDLDLPAVDARKIISGIARYKGVLPVTPGKDFLLLGTHFDLELVRAFSWMLCLHSFSLPEISNAPRCGGACSAF